MTWSSIPGWRTAEAGVQSVLGRLAPAGWRRHAAAAPVARAGTAAEHPWMPSDDALPVHVRVLGPRGTPVVESIEPLSPYGLQVLRDHVLAAGREARVEITVPRHAGRGVREGLDAAFARQRARGFDVRVVREGDPRRAAPAADPARVLPESRTDVPREAGLLLGLAMRVGTLLHELQRERSYASVQAASAGALFEAESRRQHAVTDGVAETFRSFVETYAEQLPRPVALGAEVAFEALAQVPRARVRATALDAHVAVVLDAYARIVASLLTVARAVAASGRDGELARMALAYTAFLYAKEEASRERAEVASAWAIEGVAPDPLAVESRIASREAFLTVFEMGASPTVLGALRRCTTEPDWEGVSELEDLARSRIRPDATSASAALWLERMTGRLDRLRELEDLQLDEMLRRATLTKRH
jgi:hypothetical protein